MLYVCRSFIFCFYQFTTEKVTYFVQFSSGSHQEQASKQRCTFRTTTFSSVQFSSVGAVMGVGFLELSLVVFVSLFTI